MQRGNVQHQIRIQLAMQGLELRYDAGMSVQATILDLPAGGYDLEITMLEDEQPGTINQRRGFAGRFIDPSSPYAQLYPKGFIGSVQELPGGAYLAGHISPIY